MNLFSLLGIINEKEPIFAEKATNFVNGFSRAINETIANFSNAVNETIRNIVNSDFFKGLSDFYLVSKLYDIGYPPCLHLEQEEIEALRELVTNTAIEEEYSQNIIDEVEKIIFSSYSESKLNSILEDWKSCEHLNKFRLSALEEAINAYNKQNYFSAVAIITCQIEGVINDNGKHLKKLSESNPDNEAVQRHRELVAEQLEMYEQDDTRTNKFNEHIPKLKAERQLFLKFTYINLYAASYFKEFLYGNLCKNDKRLLTHPNRDKICHGVDATFGTQHKALKLILCFDSLIRLFLVSLYEDEGNKQFIDEE